jgi:DNA-binding GntR family transcriptional regulator
MTMSFTFTHQSNISLREKVTNDLREAILNGHIEPGQRIKELDVADQMGVSRGPVREAIRQLEREGLLISYPYKETVVADLGAEEVKYILLPIRSHIESFVIERYLGQMDESFFSHLQNIVDRMQQSLHAGEINKLVDLDIEFHQTILTISTERTVMLTWQSIINQIRLHFSRNLPYQYENIATEHHQYLEAIRTKDPQIIRSAIQTHMDSDDNMLCFQAK